MRLIPLEQLQRGRVAVLEVNTVGRTLLFSISHTAINPAEGNGSDCSQDLWTPSLSSQATHGQSQGESNLLTRSSHSQTVCYEESGWYINKLIPLQHTISK